MTPLKAVEHLRSMILWLLPRSRRPSLRQLHSFCFAKREYIDLKRHSRKVELLFSSSWSSWFDFTPYADFMLRVEGLENNDLSLQRDNSIYNWHECGGNPPVSSWKCLTFRDQWRMCPKAGQLQDSRRPQTNCLKWGHQFLQMSVWHGHCVLLVRCRS